LLLVCSTALFAQEFTKHYVKYESKTGMGSESSWICCTACNVTVIFNYNNKSSIVVYYNDTTRFVYNFTSKPTEIEAASVMMCRDERGKQVMCAYTNDFFTISFLSNPVYYMRFYLK